MTTGRATQDVLTVAEESDSFGRFTQAVLAAGGAEISANLYGRFTQAVLLVAHEVRTASPVIMVIINT